MQKKELTWRSYTAGKALPTTKRIELINKKEFAKATLDKESETFVIHIAILEASPVLPDMTMHHSRAAQIAALKQDEALSKVLSEYADYANIFSFDLAMQLPKNTCINKHAIKLHDGK